MRRKFSIKLADAVIAATALVYMVYWQLKELKWNGVSMTKEAKAILTSIKASRVQRVAA